MAFPVDFLWGTATASYQVEGAAKADGRGVSIWDTFSAKKGCVVHGHTGDVAADQYNRYAEDVGLMRDLGVGAYRFSLSWPRIQPAGSGPLNPAGFDYYHRLIDALLSENIAPAVTLYHWDLPRALEDSGGWPERETAKRFAEYSDICFRALGDKVSVWITINEPWCAAYLGYENGIHAPGRKNRLDATKAVHHLNLAHGESVKAFRAGGYKGKIGITLNLSTPRPATRREEDVLAADRAADRDSRMFTGPIFSGEYPERFLNAYPDLEVPVEPGDLDTIHAPVDFLGVNYYSENAVAAAPDRPEGWRIVPSWQAKTDMGWEIVPEGLNRQLRWVRNEIGDIPLYITENGCAQADRLSANGERCHDHDRIAYLDAHFAACSAAIDEGINLKGYFLWSFIDNFEWAFGYTKRFGIVYCDYTDCRRIPKDSYYYYRDVIAGSQTPRGGRCD